MLAVLRADGLRRGIAGNQTIRAGRNLRELFAGDVDTSGASDDWGVNTPDRAFFDRVAEIVPADVDEMLYVGDRVDKDIRPAVAAGIHTVLVYRGPWETIQWRAEEAERLPTFQVGSLLELPAVTRYFNERADRRRPPVQLVVQLLHTLLALVRRQRAPHLAAAVRARRVPGALQLVERAHGIPARGLGVAARCFLGG